MTTSLTTVEVLPPNVTELLERAAVDVQISTAHRYPRSPELFLRRALGMATIDIETAESCLYSRPVGGGKVVEGPSIRMAEIVASAFGNIRVQSRIVEQTDRMVRCEGTAHDLESNYAAKSEVIEATVDKDGRPYSERMRLVAAKAALAKAFRDAVFKVVPLAMCKPVMQEARKVALGDGTTMETRRKKAAEWVKQIKVQDNRVFAVLGVQGWPDVGLEHLATLTGLKTAINDGEVTVPEAFPDVAKRPAGMPAMTPIDGTLASSPEQVPQAFQESEIWDRLWEKMRAADIAEDQVMAYCKKIKMATASQLDLGQLATSKIQKLVLEWDKIKGEIAAVTP